LKQVKGIKYKMTRKIGDWKNTNPEITSTTDLQKEVEERKLPLILGTENEHSPSTLINWVKENPEVCVSEITRVLNLLENADWWYAISPVKAENGTILVRITIAPPKNYKLEILEDKFSEIKTISINKI
jgi:hypothetical protein